MRLFVLGNALAELHEAFYGALLAPSGNSTRFQSFPILQTNWALLTFDGERSPGKPFQWSANGDRCVVLNPREPAGSRRRFFFDGLTSLVRLFFRSNLPGWRIFFSSRQALVPFIHPDSMKSSLQVVLFFLLGLVAGLALPKRQSQTQLTVVDFSGKSVGDGPRGSLWSSQD